MLRRQRGKNILFLWVKTSVKTLPSKPSRQAHSTWSSAPSVTHSGWSGSPQSWHLHTPSALAQQPQLSCSPWRHPRALLMAIFTEADIKTPQWKSETYCTQQHYSSFGLAFCFFEESWYWADITDETLSDWGAQMRKHLKERSCCSEGKQSKASGKYSHTLKEYLFKYGIICVCNPWKYSPFIKLERGKLRKINVCVLFKNWNSSWGHAVVVTASRS